MTQFERVENAIYEIDMLLVSMREQVNLRHVATQDKELLDILEIINMARGSDALQPKVHGLFVISSMCYIQAANHLYVETQDMLHKLAYSCAEIIKLLIATE